MKAGAAAPFMVMAAVASASPSLPPLAPDDYPHLEYDRQSARAQFECFRRGSAELAAKFDRRFSLRMREVHDWFTTKFGNLEVEQARQRMFPAGFIFVGGCRIDADTRQPIDRTLAFDKELRATERRIEAAGRN